MSLNKDLTVCYHEVNNLWTSLSQSNTPRVLEKIAKSRIPLYMSTDQTPWLILLNLMILKRLLFQTHFWKFQSYVSKQKGLWRSEALLFEHTSETIKKIAKFEKNWSRASRLCWSIFSNTFGVILCDRLVLSVLINCFSVYKTI